LGEINQIQNIANINNAYNVYIYIFNLYQIKENDGLPSNICRQCIQSISRFYTFQQKSQEVDKILKYNIQKLMVYNIENVPEISRDLEIATVQATTLDYVSHECFSLDAIVDELDLQGEADAFVDELARIELQEPFAGVIDPSQLVEEDIGPDILPIINEPVCAKVIEKTNVVHSCMVSDNVCFSNIILQFFFSNRLATKILAVL
jgi:hypothetical protein